MLNAAGILLFTVIALALVFDFINGFHDSANAIATSVLTRALSMRNAVLLSGTMNFVGAICLSGVAITIGKGVINPSSSLVQGKSGQILVVAAILAAIIWNLVTWWQGLPSSSSHALIGALTGAALVAGGPSVLTLHNPDGLPKIIKGLILSPLFGFVAGAFLMIAIMNIFAHQAPSKLNRYFRWAQVVSAALMSFAHGSNDAQKSMGIITLALLFAGKITTVDPPTWVKLSCAAAMALGTASGGWRIIKTVGKRIVGLQPVHGFASETAASIVVFGGSLLKLPVSTTHVISSSVMGVGAARRLSDVKWGTVSQILLAWLMTLPVCILLGGICYFLIHLVLK
jgi:PiT family inorganic phosphate transporter